MFTKIYILTFENPRMNNVGTTPMVNLSLKTKIQLQKENTDIFGTMRNAASEIKVPAQRRPEYWLGNSIVWFSNGKKSANMILIRTAR